MVKLLFPWIRVMVHVYFVSKGLEFKEADHVFIIHLHYADRCFLRGS